MIFQGSCQGASNVGSVDAPGLLLQGEAIAIRPCFIFTKKNWVENNDAKELGIPKILKSPKSQKCRSIFCLVGGFKHFLCSPLFGEDSQFDEHIFQMG